ncbi:hypothetical protein RJ641_008741 [Dillenia turbinata]|uniref:C2H2-type domain-containing protein n=1 Tax=Dillenia turbinata TaxID=194707 RepID=A0AAN8VD04_9MAGN
MESDSPASPDRVTEETSSEDQQSLGQGRSYECTFCKRGFSNAQALGGHMNIHRKDKAKLRQATSIQLSHHRPYHLHFPYSTPSYFPHFPTPSVHLQSSNCTHSMNSSTAHAENNMIINKIKWPWILDDQLPIDNINTSAKGSHRFPFRFGQQDEEPRISNHHGEIGMSSPFDASAVPAELDLELRD